MPYASPKRTKVLLRVRRLLKAHTMRQKPDWPEQAIDTKITEEMKAIAKLPMRKLRLVAASL